MARNKNAPQSYDNRVEIPYEDAVTLRCLTEEFNRHIVSYYRAKHENDKNEQNKEIADQYRKTAEILLEKTKEIVKKASDLRVVSTTQMKRNALWVSASKFSIDELALRQFHSDGQKPTITSKALDEFCMAAVGHVEKHLKELAYEYDERPYDLPLYHKSGWRPGKLMK